MTSSPRFGFWRGIKARLHYALVRLFVQKDIFLDAFSRNERRRPPTRIIENETAHDKSRDICLYAHFDMRGMVDPHVVHALRSISETGRKIVFTSNCPVLDEAGLEAIAPYCAKVILRENSGLDFGCWQEAMKHVGPLTDYDTLLISNDSVFGPTRNLAPVISEMRSRNLDVWGMTDSWDFDYHIQSYFLFFEKRAFQSEAFARFWSKPQDFTNKLATILRGEIGLSQAMLKAGFRLGALCEYRDFRSRFYDALKPYEDISTAQSINLSIFFWRDLMQVYGMPYVKVQALRDTTIGARDLGDWESYVDAEPNYEAGMISRYLDSISAHRARSVARA